MSGKGWTVLTPEQLAAVNAKLRRHTPNHCTSCGLHVSLSEDWTLWPWPDGAKLCARCNEKRHEVDDYSEIEAAVAKAKRQGGQ